MRWRPDWPEDTPYLCVACLAETSQDRAGVAATRLALPDVSTVHDVLEITDSRLAPGSIIEYRVVLKPKGRRQYTPKWYEEARFNAPDLIALYRSGRRAIITDSENASVEPESPFSLADDAKAGNPFWRADEAGFWALAR